MKSSMNKIIHKKHLTQWVHSNDSTNEMILLEKNQDCERKKMEAINTSRLLKQGLIKEVRLQLDQVKLIIFISTEAQSTYPK